LLPFASRADNNDFPVETVKAFVAGFEIAPAESLPTRQANGGQ
jgi:hypothetical protein